VLLTTAQIYITATFVLNVKSYSALLATNYSPLWPVTYKPSKFVLAAVFQNGREDKMNNKEAKRRAILRARDVLQGDLLIGGLSSVCIDDNLLSLEDTIKVEDAYRVLISQLYTKLEGRKGKDNV